MSTGRPNPPKPCALCGGNLKLELSHIIPQFVYRWQRKTARDEDLSSGPADGRPAQHGTTRQMLCGRCEDLFSGYESEFARLVFHPFTNNSGLSVKYGGWLRKFAVSVCWRILEERIGENRFDARPKVGSPGFRSCRETWHHYLRGKRPDVDKHHVHFVSLMPAVEGGDKIKRVATFDLDHSTRTSIERDVSSHDREAFVYAKLGPIAIFGLIEDPDSSQWQGTRINAEGKLKPRDISVPSRYLEYVSSASQVASRTFIARRRD